MTSPGFLFTALAFLLVIGPLIFIHELGHYFVGRLFGVKAETFSIGFGKELIGWTDRRGTRWKVAALPLGGYVRFAGDMNPASTPTDEWLALSPEERAQTFQAQPVWQRFLIVLAGPATNFLFAILAFIAVFATMGYPTSPAIVAGVAANSPAAAAGIRAGDRIESVDGHAVDTFADLQGYVMLRPDQMVRIGLERAGAPVTVDLRTAATTRSDQFGNRARVGMIGVAASPSAVETRRLPAGQVVTKAITTTWDTVDSMVVALGQVVSGRRSVQELGGPLKIAEVSGQQASLGWLPFFWLMTMISINLGFINLLPIPLLDGGHLLFYAIEAVRGKPIQPRAQEWAFRTGLALLLALMIFVTLNDLSSFGLFSGLRGLIG